MLSLGRLFAQSAPMVVATPSAPAVVRARDDDYPGHAVEGGVLRYVSVSQVNQFDVEQFAGCERRWWFEKVLRIHTPDNAAQAAGKQVHAQVEHYLRSGEPVLSIIAAQGRRFIPPPHPQHLIEHGFGSAAIVRYYEARRQGRGDDYPGVRPPLVAQWMEPDGEMEVPFIGYIDLVNPTGRWLDDDGVEHEDPRGTVEVVDWKTSANIARYAKKASDLPHTHQMMGYAEWVRQAFPGTRYVRLSHGYLQTRGRGSEKRSVLIPVATVKEWWQSHTVRVVARMREVARETDVNKVAANLDACDAYSGCPHRARCPRSPEQNVRQLFGGHAMSLMDRLNRGKKKDDTKVEQGGRSTPEGHAAPRETPVARTGGEAVDAEVEALKREEKSEEPAKPKPTDVTPPDAPASGEKAATAEAVPPEAKLGLTPPVREAVDAHEAEGTGKPKRARKGGVAVQETAPKPVEASSAENVVVPVKGFVLVVDCLVRGTPMYDLDAYIAEKAAALCAEYGAADLECGPADSPLGFGKWRGALRAAIMLAPPGMGVWSVNFVGDSPRRQVAVEVLTPLAAMVVRGVR